MKVKVVFLFLFFFGIAIHTSEQNNISLYWQKKELLLLENPCLENNLDHEDSTLRIVARAAMRREMRQDIGKFIELTKKTINERQPYRNGMSNSNDIILECFDNIFLKDKIFSSFFNSIEFYNQDDKNKYVYHSLFYSKKTNQYCIWYDQFCDTETDNLFINVKDQDDHVYIDVPKNYNYCPAEFQFMVNQNKTALLFACWTDFNNFLNAQDDILVSLQCVIVNGTDMKDELRCNNIEKIPYVPIVLYQNESYINIPFIQSANSQFFFIESINIIPLLHFYLDIYHYESCYSKK